MRMSEEGHSVRDGVYIALKHIPATSCLYVLKWEASAGFLSRTGRVEWW